LAILAALVLAWIGDIIAAFERGLPGRARILDVFQPAGGVLVWSLAMVVVCIMLVLGHRASSERGGAASPRMTQLFEVVMVAGLAIAVASAVDAVVDLSDLSNFLAVSLNGLLQHLGAGLIALSAGWWAMHADPKRGAR
jgi:hypothetical protein